MSAENLDSNVLTNLDTQPLQFATSGEGSKGEYAGVDDFVVNTTNFPANVGSSDRLARFPVEAKVKHVWLYTKGLDSSSSQTLTLDVNVAFSDSAYDNTPVALQSQIPQSTGTGGVTAPATYTGANKLFGSALTVAASGAEQFEEITFSGTYTPQDRLLPMWAVLGGTGAATANPITAGGGFAQASGTICSPGGFFDILVQVAHTATTNATGTVGVEVEYVI